MKIEYAIKNEHLAHVSEVERGLKCGCTCPACGERMIARKGTKMAHHFSHESGAECSYGLETTLHLMAKEILEQEKRIRLPAVPFPRLDEFMSPACEISFDEVFLEKRLGDIVPDIMIKTHGRFLIIEIWVTHKIDEIKRQKIKNSGISTLEIDLSGLDKMISMAELKSIILEDEEHKHWVFNSVAKYYQQKWLSVCEGKEIITRGCAIHVDNCPIHARIWRGKPYANVADDCSQCKYLIATIDYYEPGKDYDVGIHETLYCSGKSKITTFSGLKAYLARMEASQSSNS